MRDIYGADIGTTIPLRTEIEGARSYQSRKPWPIETAVSAGEGVVFVRQGENYGTLFMEVYPPGAAFIRGEGETMAACEDACWAQYEKALHCPGGEHEWETRGYRNGAGFCRHCGTFKSQAFTAEELGQHCQTCGAATTWHWEEGPDGAVFQCEKCYVRPEGDPFKALFS